MGWLFTTKLPTARPTPLYRPANFAEQLDQARALLNVHGFLSEQENTAISRRVKRWHAAPGAKRSRRKGAG